MSDEKRGTMIARAAGLVLIIIGASSLLNLLPIFQSPGMATAGWTSYSPGSSTATQDVMSQLHDKYYVVSSTASFYMPSAMQALCGFAMIFFEQAYWMLASQGIEREGFGWSGLSAVTAEMKR